MSNANKRKTKTVIKHFTDPNNDCFMDPKLNIMANAKNIGATAYVEA